MAYATDSARWLALTVRDPHANNHFVYGVKSTSIYCRPTCIARLARRANVIFIRTNAEAEGLGYRPCKRCKPDVEGAGDAGADVLRKVEEDLRKRVEGQADVKLADVARSVGLTGSYVARVVKQRMGSTVSEWAEKLKMEKFMEEMEADEEFGRVVAIDMGWSETSVQSLTDTSSPSALTGASSALSPFTVPQTPDLEMLLKHTRSLDDIASAPEVPASEKRDQEFSFDDFILSDAWSEQYISWDRFPD